MSYLDVPRIHFSGLFYTAPGNLNNQAKNFAPARTADGAIDYDTGLYKYPDGTSQLFLSQCRVTSVVGIDGRLSSDPAADSLVGAGVTSPGPETQKREGSETGPLYGFAKMVDLDPDMMYRTEVYGFRIYVDLPGRDRGGFSGELAEPPQLRDLWFGRGDGGIDGLQLGVGTWHQRLIRLVWDDKKVDSPVYRALRDRSKDGLDIKIGVDMYQTRRAEEFSVGNRFGYGRLVAAIGPALEGEPAQLVPGRRLYTPTTFHPPPQNHPRISFSRQAAEEAMKDVPPSDWNRTDFRVSKLPNGNSLLIVDMFNSAPLAPRLEDSPTEGRHDTDGKFDAGDKVVVGWLDDSKTPGFTPLRNGTISFTYSKPDPATAKLKDVFWPDHSAIFQIELTDHDPIHDKPVAIQVGVRDVFRTVLQENPNGVYINVERASARLEPEKSETFDVYSYRYGQPAELPAGLEFREIRDDDNTTTKTTIFNVDAPVPVSLGRSRLTVRTHAAVPLSEMKARKALDSIVCNVTAAAAKNAYLVGEAMTLPFPAPATPPFLSLLFWQNHEVVERPTWEANIQPILRMYARLFPGMTSILDISDLATVKANAGVLKERFRRLRTNPGYMPLTRDMSPATVDMVVRFIDSLTKEQP